MSYSSLVQLGTANSKQRQRTQNIAGMDFPTSNSQVKTPLFSFGIIADVQYADIDDGHNYSRTKGRYYRNSVNLLADAIKCWNNMSPRPSFMFQLGDLIDGHNKRQGMSHLSWDKITGVLSSFDGNVYHTCGNHEYYNFTHKQIAKLLPAMTLSGSKDPDTDGDSNLQRLRYSFSPHETFPVYCIGFL